MNYIEKRLDQISNPRQWPTIPKTEFLDKGYVVYGANGKIGFYSEYNHKEETIVITCRGATCGQVHLTEPFAYVTGNAMALDELDESVDRSYLCYLLKQRKFNDVITGSAQPQIIRQNLAAIKIKIPTNKNYQVKVSEILTMSSSLINKRRETIILVDEFLSSTFLEMFGDTYKNSKGWDEDILENVVPPQRIVTYGIVQAGPHIENGVPYIKSGDIKNSTIDVSNLSRTSREIANSFKRSEVNKGDIIMSIRATVGTVALLPDELDGANLTQGTARISPGPRLNRLFLFYYLQSTGIQHWISKQVKGVTFREITLTRLREMPVLIPPIDYQNKFAEIVLKSQKLKEKYNTSLAEMENQFNSLMQKAFRGEF